MQNSKIREPSHAGNWYTKNGKELDQELDKYLQKSNKTISNIQQVKALIAPHAGLYFSGPTAAWAYQYLKPKKNLRVFLLGPCHHVYQKKCCLSQLDSFATPIGNIQVDKQTLQELNKEGEFNVLSKQDEEDEHSLEMHLPYIQKVLQGQEFSLVPIMVGNIGFKDEQYYGKLLSKYFDDENTLFILSSDFCHWGSNFDYYHYKKEDGPIHQSIQNLDHQGMNYISQQNPKEFNAYLEKTQNTICGRHPIGILLQIIQNSKYKDQLKTEFVNYAQSNQCKKQSDSSVSYASSVTYL